MGLNCVGPFIGNMLDYKYIGKNFWRFVTICKKLADKPGSLKNIFIYIHIYKGEEIYPECIKYL